MISLLVENKIYEAISDKDSQIDQKFELGWDKAGLKFLMTSTLESNSEVKEKETNFSPSDWTREIRRVQSQVGALLIVPPVV